MSRHIIGNDNQFFVLRWIEVDNEIVCETWDLTEDEDDPVSITREFDPYDLEDLVDDWEPLARQLEQEVMGRASGDDEWDWRDGPLPAS